MTTFKHSAKSTLDILPKVDYIEIMIKKRSEIMKKNTQKKGTFGRPKINEYTRDLVVRLYSEDEMTVKQIAQACNVSERSVYRIVKERS